MTAKPLSRRRYQRGSLKEERDRWILRWREDVLEEGQVKRKERREYLSKTAFKSRREAQREADRLLAQVNSVDYRPVTSGTFEQFADRWRKSVLCHHKPSTQKSTGAYLKRLVADFGSDPMPTITAERVQTWASGLKLAPKTVRNLVFTLKQIWKTAQAWGYVTHDPFQAIRLPTWEKGNVYFFSLEQQLAIIADARKPWHKVFFRLLAETGMRPGEAAGLRPEDIGSASIQVKQSVWHGKIQTPKTKTALRTFPISESLGHMLQEHIDSAKPNDYGLVFVNEAGNPILIDSFREQVLGPILKRLGITADKRCGLYAFRHGNATVMDALRVPLKVRQHRLGHADAETTLNHYTEAESSEARAVANQIGALYDMRGRVQ